MIGVYSITCPDGSMYIGQSINIENRLYQHKRMIDEKSSIYKSLKKYGVENHSFDVLEICHKEELASNERFYIHYLKSLGFKLINVVMGGGRTAFYTRKEKMALKERVLNLKRMLPYSILGIYEFEFGKQSFENRKKVSLVYSLVTVDETITKNFEHIAKKSKLSK